MDVHADIQKENRRVGADLFSQLKEVNPHFYTPEHLAKLKEERDAKTAAKHPLARTIRGSNAVEAGCLKCSHTDGTVKKYSSECRNKPSAAGGRSMLRVYDGRLM